jgi:hypothetical protein
MFKDASFYRTSDLSQIHGSTETRHQAHWVRRSLLSSIRESELVGSAGE